MERSPIDENALVRRAAAGDATAFQQLAEWYYRPISAFLFKRLRRSDPVEDLTQETFLEAWKMLKRGTLPDHFAGWLFRISINCLGKFLRKKQPATGAPESLPEPIAADVANAIGEAEEQKHLLDLLDARVGELSAELREILNMKHVEGRTCEEIARITSKPVGTVKSLLARTYKLLREQLAPTGGKT